MKKTLFLLVLTLLGFNFSFAQQITQKNIDVTNFPEIQFTINYYNPHELSKQDFKIQEQDNEIDFELIKNEKAKIDSVKEKVVLILLENNSYSNQTEFYKDVLLGTINSIVNSGDKVNIALFNPKDNPDELAFLFDNFTDNTDTLINNIINIKGKYGKCVNLYNPIEQGLNYLKINYPNEPNRFILVLSAGHFNGTQPNEDLKLNSITNKIPLYMVQFKREEVQTIININDIDTSGTIYIPNDDCYFLDFNSFIKNTYGKHILTKDVAEAQSELINFFEQAVARRQGYDYTFKFETLNAKKNTQQYIVKLIVAGKEKIIEFQYCKDIACVIKTNIIWFAIGIGFAFLILIIVIIISKKNKKKRENEKEEQKQKILLLEQEAKRKEKDQIDRENKAQEIANQEKIIQEQKQKIFEDEQNRIKKLQEDEINQKILAQEKLKNKERETELLNQMKIIGQLPKLSYNVDGEYFVCDINKPEILFGREGCDYNINNKYISRKHFKIFFENNNYYLKHLSDTNETFVNEISINDTIILNDRDLIIAGPLAFTFSK